VRQQSTSYSEIELPCDFETKQRQRFAYNEEQYGKICKRVPEGFDTRLVRENLEHLGEHYISGFFRLVVSTLGSGDRGALNAWRRARSSLRKAIIDLENLPGVEDSWLLDSLVANDYCLKIELTDTLAHVIGCANFRIQTLEIQPRLKNTQIGDWVNSGSGNKPVVASSLPILARLREPWLEKRNPPPT
jgi:hypothetical protein